MTQNNSNKNNTKYIIIGLAIGGGLGVVFNKVGIGIAVGVFWEAFIGIVVGKK
ncbi:hypothetical protein [uncultured Clostridium sp.]|uniref:hypothetical protein n=1 Tax=uncultured Clostridium sp. TaxID=59620 RepID=UPI0028EB275F|nr:hypothetical protein [uncultured Clostridium sp.]